MNNVQVVGRLTRDVEMKGSETMPMAMFTVAVDKPLSKDKREAMAKEGKQTANFISCKAWGKLAELIGKSFSKGQVIALTGHIDTGSYEKDGQKIYTTDVNVSNITFVESQGSSTNAPEGNAPEAADDINEDDIPF